MDIIRDFILYWVFIPVVALAYAYGLIWTGYAFLHLLPWPGATA